MDPPGTGLPFWFLAIFISSAKLGGGGALLTFLEALEDDPDDFLLSDNEALDELDEDFDEDDDEDVSALLNGWNFGSEAELEEENRKIWNKGSSSVIGITSPAPPGPQLEPAAQNNNNEKDKLVQKTVVNKAEKHDKAENSKQTVEKEKLPAASANNNHNNVKTRQKDTSAIKKDADQANNRILIPTKTGKEPPKKLYPKEPSPPGPIFQAPGRFLPLGVGPMSQPHSLPIYPVQLPAGVAWGQPR